MGDQRKKNQAGSPLTSRPVRRHRSPNATSNAPVARPSNPAISTSHRLSSRRGSAICRLSARTQRQNNGKTPLIVSIPSFTTTGREISAQMTSTIQDPLGARGGLRSEASGSRKRTGPAFRRARTSLTIIATINRISSEQRPANVNVKNGDMRDSFVHS